MTMQISAVTAAAVLMLAAPQAQQAPPMPKPAPEMTQLDFFKGSWTCEGKTNASPMGPAGKFTSTANIQNNLGGFWQSGTIKGTMPNMPAMEGMFHATYDPSAKQFVMLWVDNMGGSARSTSSGWQQDSMIYEGDMSMPGQKPAKGRDTFTKSGATTMKHSWEVQMDGKWTPLGEETCTKK
jgi:uncharacterized protein DUF1579